VIARSTRSTERVAELCSGSALVQAAAFCDTGASAKGAGVGTKRTGDEYRVMGVAERLGAYEAAPVPVLDEETVDDELVDRAARLLSVMPRHQLRATIESLVSPNDLERGRRAIDALIDAAFAIEDETGHIRRAN
jgi:hypothetical protein